MQGFSRKNVQDGHRTRPISFRRLLNPLDILILLGAFVNLLVIGAITVLYFLKA